MTERQHHSPFDTEWGCEFGLCLSCPLPVCKYDMTVAELNRLKTSANERGVRDLLGQGLSVKEVAGRMELASRTVNRIMERLALKV